MTELAAGSLQPDGARARAVPRTFLRVRSARREYLVTLAAGADSKAVAISMAFRDQEHRSLDRTYCLFRSRRPGPAKMEELRGQSAQIKAVQPNFIYRRTDRNIR